MGRTKERKVGDVVYPPYRPHKLGLVVSATGHPDPWHSVISIQWKDGSVTKERSTSVNRYDDLIDDHERKLENHRRKKVEFLEHMKTV